MKRLAIALLFCGISAHPIFGDTIGLSTGSTGQGYAILSDTNCPTIGPNCEDGMTASVVTSLAAEWVSSVTDGVGDTGVWIAPAPDQGNLAINANGTTVYQETFSLSGLDPTTAILTMNLTGDDFVSSVTLNGNTIYSSVGGVSPWTSATGTLAVNDSSSYFDAGPNTLVFTVPNYGSDGAGTTSGPTGLIVAGSVTADETGTVGVSTPEPGSLGLMLIGLTSIVAGLMRRKRLS
jgi:hypothetical protein